MKSRKTSVDASSIADIAFILLAFIMIATTLKREEGLPAKLPEIDQGYPIPVVKERILEIYINKNEEIRIEDEYNQSLEDVKHITKLFMTSQNSDALYNRFVKVTKEKCVAEINELTNLQKQGAFYSSDQIDTWKKKLETVELVGDYKTLAKDAYITISYDKSTSYGAYLEIRDHIMQGINELRNELAIKKFGISYSELEEIRLAVKTNEQMKQQRAIEYIFPSKIVKLEPTNK